MHFRLVFRGHVFGGEPALPQPQGDPALVPAIVRDLEATYGCDVVEDWEQHRTPDEPEKKRTPRGSLTIDDYTYQHGGISWPTSEESSKSTKSTWMSTMRRRAKHLLQSLAERL